MNLQVLIEELRQQMKEVQEENQNIVLDLKTKSDLVFDQNQEENAFNPKYISIEEYRQIVELEKFISNHPGIKNAELKTVLSGNFFYFGFLRNLQETIPNLAQTIKVLGAKGVAGIYIGTKLEHIHGYEL